MIRARTQAACWLVALAILVPAAAAQEPEAPVKRPFEQPAQIINVTAANFEFIPSSIHIKAGRHIQLVVTATDKTHAIRISPFPEGASGSTPPGLEFADGEDCWKLKKGVSVKIDLVGHMPGTYKFACCKQCGSGHKRMKGELVVDP